MADLVPETKPTILSEQEMDQILLDLQGFGITEMEQSIVIPGAPGQPDLEVRLSNISPDDEIEVLIKTQDFANFGWVNKIRSAIMARSITWMNGISLRSNPVVMNPRTGERQPIKTVLEDMLNHSGQEVVQVLWKLYMVHVEKVEARLYDALPDAKIMTAVEKRFMDRIRQELDLVAESAVIEVASTLEGAPLPVPEPGS